MKNMAYLKSIVFGLLIMGILIPNTPLFLEIPGRDSGVFLYVGSQILDGKIPYNDVWDHKPPAIYYIDALGLFIGNGSIWGVLFIEFLFLYFAFYIGFNLLEKSFGTIPAIFGSIAWLTSLVLLLDGGNLTEEFGLVFQFITLYLFLQADERDYSYREFLIGSIGSIAFLLKPNLIGIWISIIIYLFVSIILFRKKWRILLTKLTMIFFGAISILAVVAVFFVANNALDSFLDAVFRYNIAYSNSSFYSHLTSIFAGMKILSQSGTYIISLTAWIVLIACNLFNKVKDEYKQPLLYLSLIAFPIEFILATISGRSYVSMAVKNSPFSAV